MPGRREIVDIILKAAGAEAVGREFDKIAKSAKGAGEHVETGFKGKMQQAGSFVSAAMPALLATGGAAIAGFAIKGISDFQNLALASGKMADATGLQVEEASRLIEVFGDVGVSGEQVQGAILKMNKAIGTNRSEFEKLHLIGATTNETFGNVITYLNGIKDPADRAREGTRLLGKSWGELAEVIEAGGDDLKASLDKVADTKVIDEGELARARRFREAMDSLKDVVEGFSLSVGGELVRNLGMAAGGLQEMLNWMTKIEDFASGGGGGGGLLGWAADAVKSMGPLGTVAGLATDAFVKLRDAQEKDEESKRKLVEESSRLTDAQAKQTHQSADLVEYLSAQTKAQEEANEASKRAYDAYRRQREAAEGLIGASRDLAEINVDLFEAQLEWADESKRSIQGATKLADLTRQQAEAQAKANGQTLTAAQGLDVWNRKMLDSAGTAKGPLRDAILTYITTANNIPAEKVTELSAAIDAGDYARARAILAQGVAVAMRPYVDQSDLAAARSAIGRSIRVPGRVVGFAAGTDFAPGGMAVVGERGPEVVNLPRGSQVVPNHELRGAANLGGLTINGGVTVVANDPETFVRQLETYARRNGRGRLQKIVNG